MIHAIPGGAFARPHVMRQLVLISILLNFISAHATSCEEWLSTQNSLRALTPECKPMECNFNVIKVYEGLTPEQKREAKILIIAPTSSQARIQPLKGRAYASRSQWNFHVVVLLNGRVLDPEDDFLGLTLEDYLKSMIEHWPHSTGLWILAYDEYVSSTKRDGWLYIFNLLTQPPNILWSELIATSPAAVTMTRHDRNFTLGKKIKVRYWKTPTLDFKESQRQCVEGIVRALDPRSISVETKEALLTIPLEALHEVSTDEGSYKDIREHKGWWNFVPGVDQECL